MIVELTAGARRCLNEYLAFGTFIAMFLAAACLNVVLGPGTILPFLLIGIVTSFCLARASLSVVATPAGAERWLIYPSLIIVYVPMTVLTLLWPAVVAIVTESLRATPGEFAWARSFPVGTITVFVFGIVGGLWWACLAVVAWRWPAVVRNCYYPLANEFNPRRRLLVVGALFHLTSLACLSVTVNALRGKTPYF